MEFRHVSVLLHELVDGVFTIPMVFMSTAPWAAGGILWNWQKK